MAKKKAKKDVACNLPVVSIKVCRVVCHETDGKVCKCRGWYIYCEYMGHYGNNIAWRATKQEGMKVAGQIITAMKEGTQQLLFYAHDAPPVALERAMRKTFDIIKPPMEYEREQYGKEEGQEKES